MSENKFTIRVYGLLINDKKQILICDEIFQGKLLTKFPGGGLEYGESTIDCLKRECFEEMAQEVEVLDHLYTSDFFQKSIFYKNLQLFCVYYFIKAIGDYKFNISSIKYDLPLEKDGVMSFRWAEINKELIEELTFDNDKRAIERIMNLNKKAD